MADDKRISELGESGAVSGSDLIEVVQGGTNKKGTITKVKDYLVNFFQVKSEKDASGGYVGLSLYKIIIKNASGLFSSYIQQNNTANRTYTLQDKSGTLADLQDIADSYSVSSVVTDSGTATATQAEDTFNIIGSRGIETSATGKTITVKNIARTGQIVGLWKVDTSAIVTPAGSGDLRYDNATQISATNLYLSHLTDGGVDVDAILSLLLSNGNIIDIQDADNSNNYQRFEISGTPSFASATWTIPVTIDTSAGSGTTNFANNHEILIAVFGGGGSGGGGSVNSVTGSVVDNTDPANPVINAVVPNAAITGATKTKVTYDSKGLVTSGADATTADIADSTNKRYVTDAQLTVIGNTSGTNTGDQNLSAYALDADVVHDTGNETIAGIKTFSSFPVTPSSAPTTDYQTANKKYVDDKTVGNNLFLYYNFY